MRNTPRVRRLRPGDREAWDELWQRYLRFYRATLVDEIADYTFARLCAGDELVALVAVDEADRPIGLAHLVFHPSTWTAQPYCYLEDLYVHPDHRGAEVAHALFDALSRTARERGASRVYWHTQQYNGAARSLYDVVGRLTSFVVYERDL